MNAAALLRDIRQELEGLIDEMVKLEEQIVNAPKHGDAEGGKEEFEKITTQWKKLYGNVGEKAKLLQEDKRKTKIKYSFGTDRNLAAKRISDTDLLIHGLHLFMSETEGRKVTPPVLPDAFSAMMLTNQDIICMQSWLAKQKDAADDAIRACERLKRRLKELLAEKKKLKTENKALLIHAQNLEKEASELPTEELITSLRHEISGLKENIYELNDQHLDSLNTKESLNNSIQLENQKRTEFIESMMEKLNNFKDDLMELQKFGEKITKNANAFTAGPFREFSELISFIFKLKSFLDRVIQILETRSTNLTQMKTEVGAQIQCGEDMKMHFSLSQNSNDSLQKDLDALFENVSGVENIVTVMHRRTIELTGKANASYATLMADFDLEEFKKEKDVEFKVAQADFTKTNAELEKLELDIKTFEKEVSDSIKVDSHDYISATWNTNRESLIWDEKVVTLLNASDKLEDMVEEAKTDVFDEKKHIIEIMTTILNKKETDSEASPAVKYSMSTTIMLSDLTKEHEYTLTGKDMFTKDVFNE